MAAFTMNYAFAGKGLSGLRQLALPPFDACAPVWLSLPMLGERPGSGVTYCISRSMFWMPAPTATSL